MPQFEASDWPSAVQVLTKELNRQGAEIKILNTHVMILQCLLVEKGALDQITLDRFLEEFAKSSDQEGSSNEAMKLRALKSNIDSLAKILSLPIKDDPNG